MELETSLSDIPNDVLHTIFDKQLLSSDLYDKYYIPGVDFDTVLSHAMVCTSWQSVIKPFYHKLKPRMPPLILLTYTGYQDQYLKGQIDCHFVNTVRGELHKIQLPELYRRWVRSCSNDSLLTVGYDYPHDIYLLNPFSRTRVRLPPAMNVLDGPDQLKVTISSDPNSNNIVLLRHSDDTCLAICRPSDGTWTKLRPFQHRYLSSIYFEGEFYVISLGFNDDVLKLFRCLNSGRLIMIAEKSIEKLHGYSSVNAYLVDSSGDLLLVLKYNYSYDPQVSGIGSTYSYSCLQSRLFDVYKLQHNNGWVEVNDVGTNTIYLNPDFSISMPALDTEDRRENCIYFFDDSIDDPDGYMTGVYYIRDKYVELSYQPSPPWTAPLTWFTPNI